MKEHYYVVSYAVTDGENDKYNHVEYFKGENLLEQRNNAIMYYERRRDAIVSGGIKFFEKDFKDYFNLAIGANITFVIELYISGNSQRILLLSHGFGDYIYLDPDEVKEFEEEEWTAEKEILQIYGLTGDKNPYQLFYEQHRKNYPLTKLTIDEFKRMMNSNEK